MRWFASHREFRESPGEEWRDNIVRIAIFETGAEHSRLQTNEYIFSSVFLAYWCPSDILENRFRCLTWPDKVEYFKFADAKQFNEIVSQTFSIKLSHTRGMCAQTFSNTRAPVTNRWVFAFFSPIDVISQCQWPQVPSVYWCCRWIDTQPSSILGWPNCVSVDFYPMCWRLVRG